MDTCRNLAIRLLRLPGWDSIAAGLRHHARHPDRVVTWPWPEEPRLFRALPRDPSAPAARERTEAGCIGTLAVWSSAVAPPAGPA